MYVFVCRLEKIYWIYFIFFSTSLVLFEESSFSWSATNKFHKLVCSFIYIHFHFAFFLSFQICSSDFLLFCVFYFSVVFRFFFCCVARHLFALKLVCLLWNLANVHKLNNWMHVWCVFNSLSETEILGASIYMWMAVVSSIIIVLNTKCETRNIWQTQNRQ